MVRKTKDIGKALAAEDDSVLPLDTRIDTPMKKAPSAMLPPHLRKVTIYLEENDNIPPTGQFFQVDGRSYQLRAGEAAEVPVEVMNVLNDAVQDVPQVDPTTQQVVGYRKKLRFPYRLVTLAAA